MYLVLLELSQEKLERLKDCLEAEQTKVESAYKKFEREKLEEKGNSSMLKQLTARVFWGRFFKERRNVKALERESKGIEDQVAESKGAHNQVSKQVQELENRILRLELTESEHKAVILSKSRELSKATKAADEASMQFETAKNQRDTLQAEHWTTRKQLQVRLFLGHRPIFLRLFSFKYFLCILYRFL